ncbi:hypothetical protein WJX79_008778 [Trebouxia sp. C0005]|nr:MAG: hypothetical protein FRX49_09320 [Trebouxia sp. A1-2]
MPDVWERVTGLFAVTVDVFTQKVRLRGVPPIDSVGGPAEGLTYIVTGPTSGIGKETAAALLRRKANVVLACRDEKRGEQLRVALEANAKEHGNNKPQAEVMLLDVSSLQSVRSFVLRWHQQQRPLHCLINNAGIFDIGGSQGYAKSKDGLELHMATNYLGPFLLSMLLLPSLQRSASKERPARIVNLTSKMADTCTLNMRDPHLRAPGAWSGTRAYSQSKLCQIISTAEMRRRLAGDDRVFVCAVDPGLVITNVVRTTPGWIQYLYRVLLTTLLVTPKEGARSSVHCATSEHITEEKSPSQCYINFTCKPVRPKARFVDPASGKWLWQWSAETTGLPAEVDLPEQSNGFA